MSNEVETMEEAVAAFFAQYWKAEADRTGIQFPMFFEASRESGWAARRGNEPPDAG